MNRRRRDDSHGTRDREGLIPLTEQPEELDDTAVRNDVPGTGGAYVPAATGATATYTTGTLEPGDIVPAIDKPEGEGPTPGEGPIEDPVQDADSEEFRGAAENRDQ